MDDKNLSKIRAAAEAQQRAAAKVKSLEAKLKDVNAHNDESKFNETKNQLDFANIQLEKAKLILQDRISDAVDLEIKTYKSDLNRFQEMERDYLKRSGEALATAETLLSVMDPYYQEIVQRLKRVLKNHLGQTQEEFLSLESYWNAALKNGGPDLLSKERQRLHRINGLMNDRMQREHYERRYYVSAIKGTL